MSLKVLLISEYFPPKVFGGGEISAWLLAKNLAKEGLDVSVLTSHFPELKKFEVKDKVKIYRNLKTGENPEGFLSNFKRAFLFPSSTKKELINLDKKESFDLIHCFNINSIIGTSQAKEKINKPIIMHINSLVLFCPLGTLMKRGKICNEKCTFLKFLECFWKEKKISKIKKNFLTLNPFFATYVYFRFKRRKNSLKKVDFFIAISNFMKNLLLREKISEEKIAVVPNPVELEKFLKLKPRKRKIPKILYLGAYEGFKGPQILLKALKEIKENFRANFYGSGSLEKWMKNFVERNNLSKKIKINEKVSYEKIPSLYEEHDIIVFPSLWSEPFGRVLVEGMASGKVIIASKIGGIPEVVEDRKNGFLFQPGNVSELSQLIKNLLINKNLRLKIGKEGIKTAKKKYSGEVVAKELIKVYENYTSTKS